MEISKDRNCLLIKMPFHELKKYTRLELSGRPDGFCSDFAFPIF